MRASAHKNRRSAKVTEDWMNNDHDRPPQVHCAHSAEAAAHMQHSVCGCSSVYIYTCISLYVFLECTRAKIAFGALSIVECAIKCTYVL